MITLTIAREIGQPKLDIDDSMIVAARMRAHTLHAPVALVYEDSLYHLLTLADARPYYNLPDADVACLVFPTGRVLVRYGFARGCGHHGATRRQVGKRTIDPPIMRERPSDLPRLGEDTAFPPEFTALGHDEPNDDLIR